MGAVLAVNVVLLAEDGYTPQPFAAGTAKSDLPEWAVDRITNPDAWADGDEAPRSAERSADASGPKGSGKGSSSTAPSSNSEGAAPVASDEGSEPDSPPAEKPRRRRS